MFYQAIRDYITDRGIKYRAIAKKINVTDGAISAMMSGKRKISVEEYAAICKALEVGVDFFVKRKAKEDTPCQQTQTRS